MCVHGVCGAWRITALLIIIYTIRIKLTRGRPGGNYSSMQDGASVLGGVTCTWLVLADPRWQAETADARVPS